MIEELRNKQKSLLTQDLLILHEAIAILKQEGQSYQSDINARLIDYINTIFPAKTQILCINPDLKTDVKTLITTYENERKNCYETANQLRNKTSDEKEKRELYTMQWEIPDKHMENILPLFREAIERYNKKHNKIMTEHPGVILIRQKLATLGGSEVNPKIGDPFGPKWHLNSDSLNAGFNKTISSLIQHGYKRNNRRLLKAVVQVR